jgi:hypothetical protein
MATEHDTDDGRGMNNEFITGVSGKNTLRSLLFFSIAAEVSRHCQLRLV